MPKFVPRQRKHKVIARSHDAHHTPSEDANPTIIVPAEQAARNEKKRKLKEELRGQARSISSKKQKRLDKYIENKLKKDENLEYLRLLEREKEQIDVVKVKSEGNVSSHLGKRSFDDFANGSGHRASNGNTHRTESDGESEDSFEAEHAEAFAQEEPLPVRISVQQGSGLAKPLEVGEDGLPIIQTRQRKKKRQKPLSGSAEAVEDEQFPEWEGFSDDQQEAEELSVLHPRVARLMATIDDVLGEEGLADPDSEEADSLDDSQDSDDYSLNSGSKEDGGCEIESNSETSGTSADDGKARTSAFKAWATQQLNSSLGHTPFYDQESSQLQLPSENRLKIEHVRPALNPILNTPLSTSEPTRKTYAVHVQRNEVIQQSRSELPVVQREQEIMEAIHNNPVVIIKGDTGSGKTTQIPQFLYEAGFGSADGPTPAMIGITQPRRVAAVSMAKRVSDELGDHGDRVSHQIRFDSTVSSKTAVKFMTDGIMLRELSEDLLLRKYSVIVIDEAHERSVNTDILIGLLSKIIPARLKKSKFNPYPTPLKLVIMSATLNLEPFINDRLFPPNQKPPIVEAEGRQHRVTTHFALRSRADYVDEVVEKVRRAHRKLPKGGILVFLTGQNEIRDVGNRLHRILGGESYDDSGPRLHTAATELPLESEDMELETVNYFEDQDDFNEIEILTDLDDGPQDNEFDVSDDEDVMPAELQGQTWGSKDPYNSVHILPLYSQLPTRQQLKVFDPPPSGARPIVLATNVAETSLTIPGIRYVFDTGRSKERKYDLNSGVQSFEIDYISKASASQRAGRAGRTGPGHCWRLYTSAVYEQYFPDHAEPEILRTPAESVVLQLKSFSYPRPIAQFPFPSAPRSDTLGKAERLLKNLGALTPPGTITDLGKGLSVYPLSPRLGKIVSNGLHETALLQQVVALVASLAVSEIFVSEAQISQSFQENDDEAGNEGRDKEKQAYGRSRATLSRLDKSSDAMKLLMAVSMYNTATDKEQFCTDYFLRPKAMHEISQLQGQLISIVKANQPATHLAFNSGTTLSTKQVKQLNLLCASGYIDQVAVRADLSPNPPNMPNKPRRAIDVPYLPLSPLSTYPSAPLLEKVIFIHPSSVLARYTPKDLPAYITYTHLQKSQLKYTPTNEETPSTTTRMLPLTPIDRASLVQLARDTALLELGKPVANSKIEEIKGSPRRRECWVNVELTPGTGTVGRFAWPMPPVRVRQVLDVKSKTGWRVEEWLS